MKNKKLLFPALLPSFIIMIGFIIVGSRVMMKYRDTPGDWHFIAASVGVSGFAFLFVTLGTRLVKQIREEQKVQKVS